MNLTYESYLSYMKHINWKDSKYRVMTEEEFEAIKDYLRFVTHGYELLQPMKQELF